MFIDTHCHLTDDVFTDKKSVICQAEDLGVKIMINAGYDIPSSKGGLELSKTYRGVYFLAGVHPSDIKCLDDTGLQTVKALAQNEKCVGIGEIGLDYHYDDGEPKNRQIEAFIKQIDLAYELKLPICIHSRDATQDTLNVLKENKQKLYYGAVMHCFSGSVETAKILWKEGIYTSFSGTVTFKNAKNLIEVAKVVPSDLYLTETDSPYLAPHPYRGEVNNPKLVVKVYEKLAEVTGKNIERIEEEAYGNAKRIYKKL